ncbi:unnamed protein product, partial [Polarella glacialis]
ALELLQKQRTRYVLAANKVLSPEAHSQPWSSFPALAAHLRDLQYATALFHAYSVLPAVLASGLPILIRGCGLVEVSSTAAFWLLVRPAVGVLEVSWWVHQPDGGRTGMKASLRHVFFAPAALAAAAHFYWTWGLFELAVRRRPASKRMGAVGLLAALLLPVPFAQVHLGQLLPMEATASGLLGQLLGILVFLSLRLAQHRRIIKALPIRGSAAQRKADGGRYRLHDNLSDFWGGCSWY